MNADVSSPNESPNGSPDGSPNGSPMELSGGSPFGLPPGLLAAAVIDLAAIRHNVRVLAGRAGPAAVMAVVKADAYGHGLVPSARAAVEGGASWLGVAQLGEALALREAGLEAKILSWLTVPGDAYAQAVAARIDIGVSTFWALDEVAAAAREKGTAARVHIKIDTGLNRNGVNDGDWPELLRATLKLQAEGVVNLVGLFSHYAWADAPTHPTVAAQTEAFAAAVAYAEAEGAQLEVRHLANSAATLTNPAAQFDLVRPGIAVYGLSPVPDLASAEDLGLRPAMTLLARVANVKTVGAGQGISYGHAYTTTRDTVAALIPIGYADGLPRHAGDKGPVQLAGRRYRVAGRVCMDQVVVDLGRDGDTDNTDNTESTENTDNKNEIAAGDVAVLFGGAEGQPTAQDWADAAGTISYEIVTRLGARVPRLYIDSEAALTDG